MVQRVIGVSGMAVLAILWSAGETLKVPSAQGASQLKAAGRLAEALDSSYPIL
jgi:hypothetical protein